VRAHGRELLDADEETDVWRARHAEHYCELAERIHSGVRGPDELDWMARFDAERHDLRAPFRWALDAGQIEIALRTVGSLAWTWWERGIISEGERAIEAVMERVGGLRLALQSCLVADWGLFAQQHVDCALWSPRCNLAITLGERANAPNARGYALLGLLESFLGHRDTALELIEQARSLVARDADEWEWGYTTSCSVHTL